MGWLALLLAAAAIVAVYLLHAGGSHPTSALPNDAQARAAAAILARTGDPPEHPPALPQGASATLLARKVTPLPVEHTVLERKGVRLSGGPFMRVGGTRQGSFVRLAGTLDGLRQLPLPPWYLTMQPSANEYAPLASADVNGDGWPDLAVGTAYGVFLYLNLGGHFALEQIHDRQLRGQIVTDLALVDLDGDGRPDLFVCLWMHGCSILWNRHGSFSAAGETLLPRQGGVAVAAAAFADFNRDGRVDIVTGANTDLEWNFYPRQTSLELWQNRGGHHFVRRTLAATHGETLSLLASDLNGDGWPDLYVGNDFDEPDVVFLNQDGHLVATNRAHDPFPASPMSTMSVDSGDLTNDGRPELYADNIAYGHLPAAALERRELAPGASCRASYADDASELARCEALAEFQTAVIRSRDITSVNECKHFSDPVRERDCVAAGYLWNESFVTLPKNNASRAAIAGECARVPASLATIRDLCPEVSRNPLDYGQSFKTLTDAPPQRSQTNLLFAPSAHGYRDVTTRFGAGFGGWSWDAQFVDLNNDGWQDLFITQGTRLRFLSSSNIYYRNEHGRRLVDAATKVGLADHVPTGGAAFLDINMDGRLDIVTHPFGLTPVVFGNDLKIAPGLELSLRDDRSQNRDAIGARVVIHSPDGRQQMREIKASGGFQSQSPPVAVFGLGDWPSVASLSVRWPDGSRTELRGLKLRAGRYTLERTAR